MWLIWAPFCGHRRRVRWALGQGDLQESFHPNAYAQQGIGRCLTLLWSASPGRYACRNTPGQSYMAMTLAPA